MAELRNGKGALAVEVASDHAGSDLVGDGKDDQGDDANRTDEGVDCEEELEFVVAPHEGN